MVLRADHVPTEEIEAADGRTALADEIKLRAERGEDESRPKVTAVSLEEEAAAKEAAVATADNDSDSDSDDRGDDNDA